MSTSEGASVSKTIVPLSAYSANVGGVLFPALSASLRSLAAASIEALT